MKLNIHDKTILYELDKNCRMSFSKIGEKIKRSPQFVKFRFEKLVDNKTIQTLFTVINPELLNYQTIDYFIKIQGIKLHEEQEMLDLFFKNPFINKIYRMEGYYDYFISFAVKDFKEFEQLLNKLYVQYRNYFVRFDNVNEITNYYYDKNYLLDKKGFTKQTHQMNNLEKDDSKILSALIKNPRENFTEISHNLSYSIEKIKASMHRINKLITRYSIVINPKLIYHHLILIRLKNFSNTYKDKLLEFCNVNPNIINYTRLFGTWDIKIHVEIDDRDDFRRLVKEIKYSFEGIIDSVEYCYIYQIDKHRSIPIEYPYEIFEVK